MSGLGRIQRAILMRVDDGNADFYALKDLANWIYHRPANNTQQQVVLRAARSIARRHPRRIALAESGGLLRVISSVRRRDEGAAAVGSNKAARGKLSWHPPTDPPRRPPKPERPRMAERARALVHERLANGPKPEAHVVAAARAAAIPKRSLIAAADVLGVRTRGHQWWLPE